MTLITSDARKVCGVVFATLLMSSSAVAAETTQTTVIDDPVYTHAQRLVEVDPGRRLNLYCTGKGSPTVIFDSGLTDETDSWAWVQPVIAAHTQACSYDRAGSGFSDPGRRDGNSANIVDDLHRLLVAASIKPPYILVGASYGGMNVQLYADTYPSEVVGMVLVDPTTDDWVQSAWKLDMRQRTYEEYHSQLEPFWQGQRDCVKAAEAGFVEGTDIYKQCVPPPDPHFSEAINNAYQKVHLSVAYQLATLTEDLNVHEASADEVRAARRWYGDMPLIVLAKGILPAVRADETVAHRDAIARMLASRYDELAALSTRGINRVVPDSGHDIAMDQPGAVNDAILEVLKDAGQKR
ncbi:MAG TPA: alpha/beta hydrolase [Gammaproteobacteria bacterium]|jgi:pimeloyl-ACP methyl ester carboxylesterase